MSRFAYGGRSGLAFLDQGEVELTVMVKLAGERYGRSFCVPLTRFVKKNYAEFGIIVSFCVRLLFASLLWVLVSLEDVIQGWCLTQLMDIIINIVQLLEKWPRASTYNIRGGKPITVVVNLA